MRQVSRYVSVLNAKTVSDNIKRFSQLPLQRFRLPRKSYKILCRIIVQVGLSHTTSYTQKNVRNLLYEVISWNVAHVYDECNTFKHK